MENLSLNGEWKFKSKEGEEWLEGRVPGDVYNDLLGNDRIPDPFAEKNESRVQWVGKTDWIYEKEFELSRDFLDFSEQVLNFKGLDTVAEISLNGQVIGRSKNAHRRYEYHVGELLKEGGNELRVKFYSPVRYGQEQKENYRDELSTIRFPVDQPGREFIRKPQCHFGWDWGPSLPTLGIWRDVELIGFNRPRIKYVTTSQEFEGDDVTLRVRTGLDVPETGNYKFGLAIANREREEELQLKRGQREVTRQITVKKPDLWWPTGYGEQNLYKLQLSLGGSTGANMVKSSIGFRKLELIREEDSEGESFYFEVNGTPIFVKGANMIPVDALPGRFSRDRYDDLLQSVLEANMNTIRVWGGGIYETDDFYEICDEKGILVWQDFAFACSPYPSDESFLENVKKEVRTQARRLSHHPSLALWCGDNENEWLGEEGNYSTEELTWKDLKKSYEKLNGAIRSTINEEDPGRPFWPSSPSSQGKSEPNDQSIGDSHYWDVWHGGKPFSDYLSTKPRFVSEFGYQSFSSPDLLSSVMEEGDLNPTSPMMEYRQRHPRGNELIVSRMTDNFRFPFSFEDFVYLSQIQQGLAMKTAIEHWRRLKPHCMGTLYWQLNDVWPSISWSSIEYSGRWKALHYMAKRFYSPLLVSIRENDGELELWITSDLGKKLNGVLETSVFNLLGEKLRTRSFETEVPRLASARQNSIALEELTQDEKRDNLIFQVRFRSDEYESTNYHFFTPFKSLDLAHPGISASVKEKSLTLRTEHPALFVQLGLKTEELSGRFSRNYFHLLPGDPIEVKFIPSGKKEARPLRETDLSVKHLQDTY